MANLSKRGSNVGAALALSLPLVALTLAATLPMACVTKEPPPTTFFESNIAPVLSTSCVRSATGSGCHVADSHGNAFGNLDLSSYADVDKRHDLLETYGPYGQPSLLIKNIPPFTVSMQSFDGTVVQVTTDIKHAGGPLLDPTGGAFQALKAWINNGATEQNTGVPANTLVRYPCVSSDPDMSVAPFNESSYVAGSIDHTKPDYVTFKNSVAPFIKSTCASGNCHGTKSNELYFLCGDDQAQLDWNYFTAGQYITNPPSSSELVRRPLAPQSGGSFHEGGTIFQTPSDGNYQAFVSWAKEHGPTTFPSASANLKFFATRVQPMLVKKGCMMLQCHSAAMGHDYRLRGGSGGSFSYDATLKNYQLTIEQMSFESPTVDGSRLIRKNVLRPAVSGAPATTPLEFDDAGGGVGVDGGSVAEAGSSSDATTGGDAGPSEGGTSGTTDAVAEAAPPVEAGGGGGSTDAGGSAGAGGAGGALLGILHRGGPLLEDFGSAGPTGAACDAANYSYDDPKLDLDTVPAYCMIREWFIREQKERNLAKLSAIAYVKRPVPGASDRAQDWDLFAGQAELHLVSATLDAAGSVALGADTKVDLTKCGLGGSPDVKRPAVSWDGTKIAFAARATSSDALAIYEIPSTGGACAKLPLNDVAVPAPSSGCTTLSGALVHNFDPAYAPDGRIVFASTRGNLALAQANVDYCGPQNTPADPSKLNSNLYVYDSTATGNGSGGLTQLTFLLNMERHPSFMDDGRLIFTTEKRAPNFYQLALRRQNLDTGDYHPLYAQRGSIGYNQADQVVHLSDKNFVAIFSQMGALHQGGALGVFNRSIGIDFTSTNSKDYPIDPTVLTASSPSSVEPAFFNHSLTIPDSAATGTPGTVGNIYTTPSAIPGGKVLVSMSSAMADPASFNGQYDLVVVDPETGASTMLIPGGGAEVVDAVGVFARDIRGPNLPKAFASALDEPNGHTQVTPGTATVDMTLLDVPLLASLLFQNTPTGRAIDQGIGSVDFYEDLPPPPSLTSLSGSSSNIATDAFGSVYVSRRLIGTSTLFPDGSSHVKLPGGVPIVLHLPDTAMSKQGSFPRWQREEIEFAPGETLNEAFPRTFFNNVCGQCHGSVSGQQIDVAVQPDILTQASVVDARITPAIAIGLAPGSRGSPMGVPATP
jgi:hypothetical protein